MLPAGPASAVVVVHLVGQVKRPGVRELPAGSRVAQAVGKCGEQLTEPVAQAGANAIKQLSDGRNEGVE